MLIKETLVKTAKENNLDISILADIHADKNTDYSVLDKYIKELDKRCPQFIAFLGDAVNDGTSIESAKRVSDYFYKMGKIAPIVMVMGNHDKVTRKGDRWYFIRNDEDMEDYNKIISIYNSVPNLNLLSNEFCVIADVKFYGIDPDILFYYDYTPYEERIDMAYSYKGSNEFDNRYYNVVLAHSPKCVIDENIINNEKKDFYKDANLILTGHMHNGLLPVYMEWILPGNKGLIGKYMNKACMFPNMAKGNIQIREDLTGIIANPVCTFSSDKGKSYKFNKLYPVPYQNVKVRKLIK